MSAQTMHAAHGHDDHHGEEEIHVTTGGYITGFILAVILTVIPFALIMGDVIQDRGTAVMVLGLFAVVQVVVHMYFFLHMNGKIQGGWTLMSTIFTVVFVAITLAGTLWVMFHMNKNMMPQHVPHQHVEAPAPAVEAAAPEAVTPAVETAAPVADAEVAPAATADAAIVAQPEHAGHGNN